MLELKLFIFYFSYFAFVFLFFLIYKIKDRSKFKTIKKVFFIIFFVLSILFIRARFIEINYISLQNTKINIWINKKVKIALISDIHLWIYRDWDFLKKVVKKINSIPKLDYVFIAWDLTYFDERQKNPDLKKFFSSFQNIKTPTYFVFWNHDVEFPWPDIRNELWEVLQSYWLRLLNNDIVKLDWFYLVWLWTKASQEDDISILKNFKAWDSVFVLTHNPDTISKYENKNVDLTLCGHTHWWQVKIPFLYKKVIPTIWDFDEWFTIEKNTKLFITSWLWVIWLPLRFLNPPVIDILEIN